MVGKEDLIMVSIPSVRELGLVLRV